MNPHSSFVWLNNVDMFKQNQCNIEVRGHPSKTSGHMGEGCTWSWTNVDERGWGGGVGHKQDVHKRKIFWSERRNILRLFRRQTPPTTPGRIVLRDTIRTSEIGVGGGCLKNGRRWTKGGSKKSVFGPTKKWDFGRTSLMNDPLPCTVHVHYHHSHSDHR